MSGKLFNSENITWDFLNHANMWRAYLDFKEVWKPKTFKIKLSLKYPSWNIFLNIWNRNWRTFLPDHSKIPTVVHHEEHQHQDFLCQTACSRLKHQIHMQCVSTQTHPVLADYQDVQHYVLASETDNMIGNLFVQSVGLQL